MRTRRIRASNSVRELLARAIDYTKESHAICAANPPADESEGSKAIARLAIVLEGRLRALEAVYDAMTGNKAMLRHFGTR